MGNIKRVIALTFVLALLAACSSPTEPVKVSDRLRILDDNPQVTNVVIQGRTLVVEHTGSADTLGIGVGDYVVGTHGTGYLRRVASVTPGAGLVTLETKYAALENVIESGSFSHTVTTGNGRAGSTLIDLSGKVLAAQPINGVNVMLTIDQGTLSWAADYNFDGSLSGFSIKTFEATATGSLDTDWDITLAMDAALNASGNIDLNNGGAAYTQDINFFVGPIPVTGKIELFFKAGYEINSAAAGGFTAGFDANAALTAGAKYDKDVGWEKIWTPSFAANKHPMTYNSTANLTAKIYVAPIIRTEFYGVPGPKLDLSKSWSGEFMHTAARRGGAGGIDVPPGTLAALPANYAVCANTNGKLTYELKVFGFTLGKFDATLPNTSQLLEQAGTIQCATDGPDPTTLAGQGCAAEGAGWVACPMGGGCIHETWFCDFISDCAAGEDETFEIDGTTACPPPIVDPDGCGGQPDFIACPLSGVCIHRDWWCDGDLDVLDCPGGEDEVNCP